MQDRTASLQKAAEESNSEAEKQSHEMEAANIVEEHRLKRLRSMQKVRANVYSVKVSHKVRPGHPGHPEDTVVLVALLRRDATVCEQPPTLLPLGSEDELMAGV